MELWWYIYKIKHYGAMVVNGLCHTSTRIKILNTHSVDQKVYRALFHFYIVKLYKRLVTDKKSKEIINIK